jgi:hypothetical protein
LGEVLHGDLVLGQSHPEPDHSQFG